LGKNREFKKTVEGFWRGSLRQRELFEGLENIQKENIERYRSKVDSAPDGELTLYDPMLDTAILCGIFSPETVEDYYDLCRGKTALEMTKWFNTNYHYLVTDFSQIEELAFRLNLDHFALKFKEKRFSSFIGPFTFLKLSKGVSREKFKDIFFSLIDVYKQLLSATGEVQIDEPAFAMDLSDEEINIVKEGYSCLSGVDCRVTLMTYYDSVSWIGRLVDFPVSAIGIDFVKGESNFDYICQNGFPEGKTLIAGLVDGRNIWRNNISSSAGRLKKLSKKVSKLAVSNAAPLCHLPISSETEELGIRLKDNLAFASEKLSEIKTIAQVYEGKQKPPKISIDAYGESPKVQERVKALSDADFTKGTGLEERRKIHDSILGLPLFPTTTIGSFPQTPELRAKRAAFRKGNLSKEEYQGYIQGQIDELVAFQRNLGLDVFVHGEFERTDMVEFFAQKLDGIATTKNGWIISYGTRCYRPPIIFDDVSRPVPMTLDEITYAQSKADKPVKGMLTGPVTIIAWSFCREDIPVAEVAYQIGLSLKDEIKDYEKAGIKIVQIDEAAFREKAPIKKNKWPAYFDWAVKSFNLTINTSPKTQIHTHMCYSEFGEIIGYINRMDFDVISIEASRSKGDIIDCFAGIDFKRQIGLGVWDIHSPAVPTVEEMKDIIKRSLRKIPKENFWINPDCGLKTRDWPETKMALKNLVETAKKIRKEYC
jgi:5-methyltetrahydropteroyltriglutamate--homocysteine methyltransferase